VIPVALSNQICTATNKTAKSVATLRSCIKLGSCSECMELSTTQVTISSISSEADHHRRWKSSAAKLLNIW
jgi:hypothetical protein